MFELSAFDCQLVSGGFPELEVDHPGKVLTKEDVCFLASMGVIFGAISGVVKLSRYPILGLSMGALAGGMIFPISAHYLGKMMVTAYEITGVI